MTTHHGSQGVKTSLRVSGKLHKWLEKKAKNNDRSLNTEILVRLEASKLREEIEETMRVPGSGLATSPGTYQAE